MSKKLEAVAPYLSDGVHRTWKAQEVKTGPLDWFFDCSVAVEDWLGMDWRGGTDMDNAGKPRDWMSAMCAYLKAGGVIQSLAWMVVSYDPETDSHFFVFKESNNGTTYVVRRE